MFGTFGLVMGLSAIAAPVLAGVLIDADLLGTGWRMVFLVNVRRNRRAHRRTAVAAPDCLQAADAARPRGDDAHRPRLGDAHLPADRGPRRGLARVDLRDARRGHAAPARVRSLPAPSPRGAADRTRPAPQPGVHRRDHRRARLLRHVRRAAAHRLAVLAARRAVLARARRADARAADRRDARLLRPGGAVRPASPAPRHRAVGRWRGAAGAGASGSAHGRHVGARAQPSWCAGSGRGSCSASYSTSSSRGLRWTRSGRPRAS